LNRDEKKAFWKFFLTYFISVALLILAAGNFYFAQVQQQLLKIEHFSLIKYAIRLKSGENIDGFKEFSYIYTHKNFENFSIDNFVQNNEKFEKWVPVLQHKKDEYIIITKDSSAFEQKKRHIFYVLAGVEFVLLSFFGFLSFFLARNALAPLKQNIQKLDRFAKDLIHDLNTPVTSIGLNLKILYKEDKLKEHKALQRLQQSANDIADLHKNLSFLLQEKEYTLKNIDLKILIEALLQDYRHLYPHLNFVTQDIKGSVLANPQALKQILDNLLSNACKYSKDKGTITLSYQRGRLQILDDGIGIKNPERIFERNYTEHLQSSGIGLDIVKRLCDVMQIKIQVESSDKGTLVRLVFD